MQSPYDDRSLIRDILTFDLARPYFDYVPETRLCELILNGKYYGVYFLSEKVSGMKLKKPGEEGDELTGGYMLEVEPVEGNEAGYLSKNWNIRYTYTIPDERITENQKVYIDSLIEKLESAFLRNNYEEICELIDVQSFIDYQLVSEFTHNHDAYTRSLFLYKGRDNADGKLKVALWDFNVSLGNGNKRDAWKTDTWRVYDEPDRILLHAQNDSLHFLWGRLIQHEDYRERLVERWHQYREESFSNESIMSKVDSLATLLEIGGAENRNSTAWNIWDMTGGTGIKAPSYIIPNKYVSSTYDDEITYLKNWIIQRLIWMDDNINTLR